MKSIRRSFPWTLLVLVCHLSLLQHSAGQENSNRRLILKDGSYQIVTKYEVKGDRVHYYSAEREEWEDLPNSLVDWPATEKWEKDRAASAASPEAVQLDKELEEESQRQEALLPLVAPGLRLPENSGVFLLDSFEGQPQVAEIQQSAGDINNDRKGNIFRGAVNPIAGLKVTVELDGAHAKVQSHVGVPSVYINTNGDPEQGNQASTKPASGTDQSSQMKSKDPNDSSDRFRIVKLEVKGNKRILGDIKRQITGKVSEEQHFMKSTTTPLNGGWLKITPTENLVPGEYALVETMGKEMNLYVWDFGINPKAPANANTWKPEVKAPQASGKPESPQ